MKKLLNKFGVVRIWIIAVILSVAGGVLLWTGRDASVLGQSVGGLLIVAGIALALLNLPSRDQVRLLKNAAKAKQVVLDDKTNDPQEGSDAH